MPRSAVRSSPMASPDRHETGDQRSGADELLAILKTVFDGARTAGGAGLSALHHGSEDAVRAFVRQRVARCVQDTAPGASPSLAHALTAPKRSALTRRIGTSGVARVARRVAPLTRRSPAAIALRIGPALYDVVTEAVREIDAVATQLVALAHDHGRTPEVARIHTATVQVIAGDLVDPGGRVAHLGLVRRWLRRMGGQLAPFGLLGGGPDARQLADALAAIDPAELGPKRRT